MRTSPTKSEAAYRVLSEDLRGGQSEPPPSLLRKFGSWCLPHDTRKTTCPPGPLNSGKGPVIIVSSIMRSGTHLILDALFNNFPALRRTPLFVDFDACARAGFPVGAFASVQGVIIKTHFPHSPLSEPYSAALASLAARACVFTPRRPPKEVCRSLERWKMQLPMAEFLQLQDRFDAFWSPFSPDIFPFATLLDPSELKNVVARIEQITGLKSHSGRKLVVPARTTFGVFADKALTRVLGCRAPRINTTIGGRLTGRKPE